MNSIAVPVICDQRSLDTKYGKDILLAPGKVLHVSAQGVEAFGFSLTMRQLYLALEAAAQKADRVDEQAR